MRTWWREMLGLVLLSAIGLWLFADGTLDQRVATSWFSGNPSMAWQHGADAWVAVIYKGTPWLMYATLLIAIAALTAVLTHAPWRRAWPVPAFVALVILLGPGLLVHGVIKPAFDRPRPRDVAPFCEPGKTAQPFIAAWQVGSSTSQSFVSGHAASGFVLMSGWFLLRRRRRTWAIACAMGGVALGALVGLARIAQGGHWISDVWWSGIAVGVVCLGLAMAMRIDRVQDQQQRVET